MTSKDNLTVELNHNIGFEVDEVNKTQKVISDMLWLLTLAFVLVLVLANWFDGRLIQIWRFDTDAGTLVFPFTFLLSDLITEVYGYKYARRAIWLGLAANIIFIGYSQLVIAMPSPVYAVNNAMFDKILTINIRVILASILSYLCAEPLNSYVMAKLKVKFAGAYMGTRFILSTILAAACDSLLFGFLAFYAEINIKDLLLLILNMWFFKVIIEALMLPVSVKFANKVKRLEKMDQYDTDTKFKIFSLDTLYLKASNKYAKLS